ncbi:MAG: type VII toxin-antitoxin system MntA family adenylyltransferase antitoxin [Desulfohalobiaceae bacterium]
MQIIDRLSQIIPELLNSFPEISVLYMFGSQARGEARADSDLDVAIFLDPEVYGENPLLDLEIQDFLETRLGLPVEVVIMQRVSPILQHQVLAKGLRLFERDPELRAKLELISFKRYLDVRRWQQRRLEKISHD